MEKQHATHHKEIPLMEAIIEPLMATIKYILFGSETKNFLGKQYKAEKIKDTEKGKPSGKRKKDLEVTFCFKVLEYFAT